MTSKQFEKPIDNAPIVKLNNGKECVPQHYLMYQHTLESVQRIVLDIEFDTRYPIFVFMQNNDIIIQVGIVGIDNYKKTADRASHSNSDSELKIVYGRKWRVEKELPTSEIIQTVFLALKVAREHEIRELFRLQQKVKLTTPFNNHHDLPLMAENFDLFKQSTPTSGDHNEKSLAKLLLTISYDSMTFELIELIFKREGVWFADIKVNKKSMSSLEEFSDGMLISLRLSNISSSELCFSLMDELIHLSNNFINENFSYQGFSRFSRAVCVNSIADLSSVVRDNQILKNDMHSSVTQMNYDIDKTRVPVLDNSLLAKKIQQDLSSFGTLSGVQPYQL